MKELELSQAAKDRLAKLEELRDEAAAGDKKASRELRRVLRESAGFPRRQRTPVPRNTVHAARR